MAAYYDLRRDLVVVPHRDRFRDPLAYYRTGHADRLNRSSLVRRIERGPDSAAWAREELQAEIASMMVGDRLGIGHDPRRHAGYAGRWAKLLREDPVDILHACYRADQTARRLLFGYPRRGRQATRKRPSERDSGLDRPPSRPGREAPDP